MSLFCAGAVLGKAACSQCRAIAICVSGAVVLRRLAWQASASVCAGVFFVGPVLQSAHLVELEMEMCQNRSKSIWRRNPVLAVDEFRERGKVGFHGSWSCSCKFRGMRSIRAWVQVSRQVWRSDHSRCGAAHNYPSAHLGWVESLSLSRGAHFVLRAKSEPSAHLGWVAGSRCGAARSERVRDREQERERE